MIASPTQQLSNHSGIYLAVCLLLALTACCDRNATRETDDEPVGIRLSEGGGVTGQFLGYTIDTEGTVSSWRGFAATRSDSTQLGSVTTAQRDLLSRTVRESGLDRIVHYETGNMTAVLEITKGELRYYYAWPGLFRDADAAPAELRNILKAVLSIIDSFENNKQ